MIELLLILRRIIRYVCRLGVIFWIIAIPLVCLSGCSGIVTGVIYCIVMTAVNLAIMTYYDKLLWYIADKRGVTLYLTK